MWIYPGEMSRWAYEECKKDDDSEIRSLITAPNWVYHYCNTIKDRPEMIKLITDPYWAYMYCLNVKDRPEMRKQVTNSKWLHMYCLYVNKDIPECKGSY